jgi:hypothetical protein
MEREEKYLHAADLCFGPGTDICRNPMQADAHDHCARKYGHATHFQFVQ